MLKFLTMLFVVVPWLAPQVEVAQHSTQIDSPELCSRAKTASPERAKAARYLQLKSSNDPLALQTDVQHYRLELEVDPAAAFIDGRTTMAVMCVEDGVTAFRFWLHSSLTINEVELEGGAADWTRLDEATVEVELDATCDTGDEFDLVVDYEGYPVTTGLSSIVFQTQGNWPVVSGPYQEPWFSYTWWAVKEDSRDKATGEMLITVPSQLTVVANGIRLSNTPVAGDRRRFRWATDYPTSPYLFAFSATRYNTFSDVFNYDHGSMPVDFFVWPERDTTENRNAWRRSVDMLDTFSQLFGLYPFVDEKYAMLEFRGAAAWSTRPRPRRAATTPAENLTAHEAAHQWWGDIVTCATWQDIWLNEGFATYSAALWYEFEPGTSARKRCTPPWRRPPGQDGRGDLLPRPSRVDRIFTGNYTYQKGGWVVHMLAASLETAILRHPHGLPRPFQYSSATSEDLREVVEEVWGADLGWFFDEWVYGGGAPAYRYGHREHEIAGQRYLEISLEQSQTEGVFAMPVEIDMEAGRETHRVTVWNSAELQHFLLPVSAQVDAVDIDPDAWILTRSVTAAAFTDGPPKVVMVDPAPGSSLPVGEPLTMTVTFHEDVVIDEADVSLQRIGGSTYDVEVEYDSGSHTATFTTLQPLAGGRYELKIRDTVVDVQGLALDGEFDTPIKPTFLPTGNGVPGGDAVIEFNVVGSRRGLERKAPGG